MAVKVIEKITNHIDNNNNFLLSGGAGSGKTYTLMEVLDSIHYNDPKANVACITYTNAAVDIIRGRTPYSNIKVSTIHDFLWDTIKIYQNNIKIALIDLIMMEKEIEKSGIKYSGDKELNTAYFTEYEINYKEYKKLEDGIISHNEILKIANYLFKTYPLLCEILIDKYDYILIDEYQDAEEQVIEIFLNYLQNVEHKQNIIGAFGDSMQSIYDNGIGDLNSYIKKDVIEEVIKEDNWRCSIEVIHLLNRIRADITQEPKGSPNQGSVKFVFTNKDEIDIDELKQNKDVFHNWDFSNYIETKELYLTHNLIASKAGFGDLFEIYNNDEIFKQTRKIKSYLNDHPTDIEKIEGKTFGEALELGLVSTANNYNNFIANNPELLDYAQTIPFDQLSKNYLFKENLIGDNKDRLIKHLFNIQEVIFLYENNNVNRFIKKTEFKIKSIQDKIDLKKSIEELKDMDNKSIAEVIEYAHQTNLVIKDDNLETFINENAYSFHRISYLLYKQVVNLYKFEQDLTPYSTQHGIKGTEFDNVFVVLDNGRWNKYNFKYLFEETSGKERIIDRTIKMFYVCCSRAKNNLVVYYHKPSSIVLSKAEYWFGKENLIQIS